MLLLLEYFSERWGGIWREFFWVLHIKINVGDCFSLRRSVSCQIVRLDWCSHVWGLFIVVFLDEVVGIINRNGLQPFLVRLVALLISLVGVVHLRFVSESLFGILEFFLGLYFLKRRYHDAVIRSKVFQYVSTNRSWLLGVQGRGTKGTIKVCKLICTAMLLLETRTSVEHVFVLIKELDSVHSNLYQLTARLNTNIRKLATRLTEEGQSGWYCHVTNPQVVI